MKTIRTTLCTLTTIHDQLIQCSVDDHSHFCLEELIKVREATNKLSGGKPYSILLEPGEFTSFSTEAKAASVTEEYTKDRIALAIIESNLGLKIVVDFYLRVNRPIVTTRAFKSKKKAIIWLESIQLANEKKTNLKKKQY